MATIFTVIFHFLENRGVINKLHNDTVQMYTPWTDCVMYIYTIKYLMIVK